MQGEGVRKIAQWTAESWASTEGLNLFGHHLEVVVVICGWRCWQEKFGRRGHRGR